VGVYDVDFRAWTPVDETEATTMLMYVKHERRTLVSSDLYVYHDAI
jgi:hypothetical protein